MRPLLEGVPRLEQMHMNVLALLVGNRGAFISYVKQFTIEYAT